MRFLALLLIPCALPAARVTLSLDGTWQIEESVAAEPAPRSFTHRAPVPGLAHSAMPAFPNIDEFLSREFVPNAVRRKLLAPSEKVEGVGRSLQQRNYFWYRRTFRAPARRQVATLRINKAQFGAAVWLNGRKIGEHLPCFSAAIFDVTAALNWSGENELIVRVGAHPGVLPASVVAGTDFEKARWTPGIYDSVSLLLADNPAIESVQVAPRVSPPQILVQTRLRNRAGAPASFILTQRVAGWNAQLKLRLGAGEERTVEQTIAMPGASLWTPEHPSLHTLETSTGGDSASTRFGLREFRFDTATRRAFLNGKPYFLRGSNVTLHRFFEDPLSGALPWDEAWVRKLLIDIPRRMHWNAFRFCIGPVPDKWLDIADEAGLLIQNEYFIWSAHKEWDTRELIAEFSEWMRDNWNHPSVAIWDASNETRADLLGHEVIPAVRKLDLSHRPWDNGYNLPSGPDDPIEDHPYLMNNIVPGSQPQFALADLERMTGYPRPNAPHPTAHAAILNEYGWLWLNRDGSPTVLTQAIYDHLLGAKATADQRRELYAYLLGGLTEFWRSRRNYAGVLHFVLLTASYPGAFTSDHFRDVARLELDPYFADYMREAFKPLGVYLNFWRPTLEAGRRRFAVSVVNDQAEAAAGRLALALEASGKELARAETRFEVPGLGQQTYELDLEVPSAAGECLLKAAAWAAGQSEPTISRRKLALK